MVRKTAPFYLYKTRKKTGANLQVTPSQYFHRNQKGEVNIYTSVMQIPLVTRSCCLKVFICG